MKSVFASVLEVDLRLKISAELSPDTWPKEDDAICVSIDFAGCPEYVFIPIRRIGLGEYDDDERSADDQRKSMAAALRALADRVERTGGEQ